MTDERQVTHFYGDGCEPAHDDPFAKLRPLKNGDEVRIIEEITYKPGGGIVHKVEEATLVIEHQRAEPRKRLQAPADG